MSAGQNFQIQHGLNFSGQKFFDSWANRGKIITGKISPDKVDCML